MIYHNHRWPCVLHHVLFLFLDGDGIFSQLYTFL